MGLASVVWGGGGVGSRTWQPWQRLKGGSDGFELHSIAKIGRTTSSADIEATGESKLVSARNIDPIVREPLVSEEKGGGGRGQSAEHQQTCAPLISSCVAYVVCFFLDQAMQITHLFGETSVAV